MSSISSGTLVNTGLVVASDTSGNLVVKTGATGNTAAVFDANGSVNFGYSVTHGVGTANGVAYLNGSKVVTTGSALTFDGTNLGIGTSLPSAPLDISGSGATSVITSTSASSYSVLRLRNTGASGKTYEIAVGGSGTGAVANSWYVYDGSASTVRMLLDANGNFGIGTSSPVNLGTGRTSLTLNGSTDSLIWMYSNGVASGYIQGTSTDMNFVSSSNKNVTITAQGTGTQNFSTNSVSRMVIDASGNILVGTGAGIDARLTVYGAGTTSANYTNGDATGATIYLRDSGGLSGNGGQILFGSTFGVHAGIKGLVTNGTGPAGELVFQTRTTSGNVVERARIDYLGKFMVGTTGSIGSATGTFVAANDVAGLYIGTSTPQGLYISANSTSRYVTFASSGAFSGGYIFNVGNTEAARITLSGGMSVGTSADPGFGGIYSTGNMTAYYSDKRLKTVRGKIKNALDKVDALSGVYYTNNDIAKLYGYTGDEVQVGVLAQDVETVLPEIVKAAPFDLDENGNSKSGEDYKTVQYERIVPLLIEAIKELRAEIKLLKGE